MSAKNILIYGLNRSGTNYLEELVVQHFDVKVCNKAEERSDPLHKHFRIYDDKSLIGRPNFSNQLIFSSLANFENEVLEGERIDIYLVISKDPYSWFISYDRWGKKNNWEPSPHHTILEYNAFYSKWHEFSREDNRVMMIRYIDLLTDRNEVLDSMQKKFSLDVIREIGEKRKIKKVPMSHRFTQKKERYYIEGEYLKSFSEEELCELNRHLDHGLAMQLHYEIHEHAG